MGSSGEFDDDDLWNFAPKKVRESNAASQDPALESGQQPWRRSREGDANLRNATPKSTQVPWKRSKRHTPFADDVATADWSNKLALAPDLLSGPPVSHVGMKYGIAVGFAGAAIIMAAGIGAYKLGSRPSASLVQPASRSGPSVLASAKFAQPLKSAPVSSAPPASWSRVSSEHPMGEAAQTRQSSKPTKLMASTVDTAIAGSDAPVLANTPTTKSEPRRLDANTIVLMVKSGTSYMANGNIIAARMMFRPAAEAGDPIAAFAFAETYDPLVLKRLDVEGGIETRADVGLALTWYRKARDLGSVVALERLDRLTHVSE